MLALLYLKYLVATSSSLCNSPDFLEILNLYKDLAILISLGGSLVQGVKENKTLNGGGGE